VIQKHLRYGGKLLGICAGFQMLGQEIDDPEGIEGAWGKSCGLGYLSMQTVLQRSKTLQQVSGKLSLGQANVDGYEIHAGISTGTALASPLVLLPDHNDGAISEDGAVAGTYIHGIFNSQEACNALLEWAGCIEKKAVDYAGLREKGIDLIADTVAENIDMVRLLNAWDSW
jgi:adenosylcobyric acid synthase